MSMKTRRPGDLTFRYCGVSTIHPAGSIGVTPMGRWT